MRSHRAAVAFVAFILGLCGPSLAGAVGVSGQGTWESTLEGRDLDGNVSTAEAWYDTVLGITWLADANYAETSGYAVRMDWYEAGSWISALTIGGIGGWRLPTWTDMGPFDCNHGFSGTDCGYNVDTSSGEMAHMHYVTLGNLAFYDTSGNGEQPGWGLTNTGPFANLQAFRYWTSETFPGNVYSAVYFAFDTGEQYVSAKTALGGVADQYAWAVHAGDVGVPVVPEPGTLWLCGTALAALGGAGRRRKAS